MAGKQDQFNEAMEDYRAIFGEYYPLMDFTESMDETINNIHRCINKMQPIEELTTIPDDIII